jgi:hypothetical protein
LTTSDGVVANRPDDAHHPEHLGAGQPVDQGAQRGDGVEEARRPRLAQRRHAGQMRDLQKELLA